VSLTVVELGTTITITATPTTANQNDTMNTES